MHLTGLLNRRLVHPTLMPGFYPDVQEVWSLNTEDEIGSLLYADKGEQHKQHSAIRHCYCCSSINANAEKVLTEVTFFGILH